MVKINSEKFKLIISFFLVIIILYFLVQSLNKEIETNKYLEEFSLQNGKIEKENKKQEKLLKMYETPEYKNLYAKENLNLLNPWEKIIILEYNKKNNNFLDKYLKIDEEKKAKDMTTKEQWKRYFNVY